MSHDITHQIATPCALVVNSPPNGARHGMLWTTNIIYYHCTGGDKVCTREFIMRVRTYPLLASMQSRHLTINGTVTSCRYKCISLPATLSAGRRHFGKRFEKSGKTLR